MNTLDNLLARQPILLFDGVCNLCSKSVQFVIRHEREPVVQFCSLQSEQGKALLTHFRVDARIDSLIFIDSNRVLIKSEAVLALAYYLRGPWRSARLLKVFPLAIRNWVYDLVARSRYRVFGKHDSCWLPDASISKRFLG